MLFRSVTGQYLLCLSVMLFPTILMGMAFPLACRLIAGHGQSVGFTIGKVYSVNTIGAIAGSLAAAFFLIPLMGMQHTIMAISLLNLGLAMFLVVTAGGRAVSSAAEAISRKHTLWRVARTTVVIHGARRNFCKSVRES